MKTRFMHTALAVPVLLSVGVVPCAAQRRPAKPSLGGVVLEIRTDRPSYALGELVTLDISARNRSATSIALPSGFDVWEGYVGVMVAFEDGPFREYRGPAWGLHDVAGEETIMLRPRQTVSTEATILYNHGMDSRHLNREAAERITARYMDEGYGLSTPGRYRIKALLYGLGFHDNIESAPVDIVVHEPEGTDRDVWNVLRADPEFGYFTQAGNPRARSTAPRRQRLIEMVERLVTDYPESRYAERLRQQLSRYRDREASTGRGLVFPVSTSTCLSTAPPRSRPRERDQRPFPDARDQPTRSAPETSRKSDAMG